MVDVCAVKGIAIVVGITFVVGEIAVVVAEDAILTAVVVEIGGNVLEIIAVVVIILYRLGCFG